MGTTTHDYVRKRPIVSSKNVEPNYPCSELLHDDSNYCATLAPYCWNPRRLPPSYLQTQTLLGTRPLEYSPGDHANLNFRLSQYKATVTVDDCQGPER